MNSVVGTCSMNAPYGSNGRKPPGLADRASATSEAKGPVPLRLTLAPSLNWLLLVAVWVYWGVEAAVTSIVTQVPTATVPSISATLFSNGVRLTVEDLRRMPSTQASWWVAVGSQAPDAT